jgi:hypothetical protein
MPRLVSLLIVALVFVSQAMAQPAQTRRIRGTIESLDGNMLMVKARDGASVKIALADNYVVTAYTKKQLSDIVSGSYIGVGAMPQADGSQKAISISIFPESARGLGDGHRPWDLPNSTMTNGAVAEAVASADGLTLIVKYKDGEKKIVVTPTTSIATFGPGEKTEVKPGVAVAISATVEPDGVLESNRVGVGRDGFVPN